MRYIIQMRIAKYLAFFSFDSSSSLSKILIISSHLLSFDDLGCSLLFIRSSIFWYKYFIQWHNVKSQNKWKQEKKSANSIMLSHSTTIHTCIFVFRIVHFAYTRKLEWQHLIFWCCVSPLPFRRYNQAFQASTMTQTSKLCYSIP